MGKLLVAISFCILCALGFWQLQRLEWKEKLLASITTAQQQDPLDLSTGETPTNFRRVLVQGTYDRGHDLIFPAKTKDGTIGLWTATPFISSQQTYIINRGWMPKASPAPTGELILLATARYPEPPHWFQPANNLTRNQWYSFDLPAMARATGHANVAPFYIVLGEAVPDIPNNHLQYAITWFALAGILLFLSIIRARRPA